MADSDDLRRENEALKREIARLKDRIAQLESAIRKLTAQLKMSSRNSSMPPSTDLARGRVVRRVVRATGRKRGAQTGHPGRTRRRFTTEELDHVVELVPERCGECRARLKGEGVLAEAHQVVEVPPGLAEVTEYRRFRMKCSCGASTTAELPEDVPSSCVGVRLQAILATLTGRYRLSRREAQEILVCLYGEKAAMALGTILALEARTSQALQSVYEEALSAVRASPVAHLDETSWRQDKDKAWLWGAITRTLSVFLIDRHRGAEAFRTLMGARYPGTIQTDRWTSYHGHPKTRRGLCWAHLKRDFQALKELGHKGASRIGNAGLRAEAAITAAYRRYLQGEIAHESLKPLLQPSREALQKTLLWGRSSSEPKAAALCRDVLKRHTSLWTFTRRKGVEPTNNRAERGLRKAVLWRKGSFGSDSPGGSRFAERMLTVSESLRSQGRPVLDFVEKAIRAHKTGSPHPSLLPLNSS